MEELISATEARRNFLRILKEVEKGNVYVVTRYGHPTMRIEPVGRKKRGVASKVERSPPWKSGPSGPRLRAYKNSRGFSPGWFPTT